jgi:YVTN family beta-propeller protein
VKLRIAKLSLSSLFILGMMLCWHIESRKQSASAQAATNGPTSSGPIALTPNDRFVLVSNPDTDSVSVPYGLAFTPNGTKLYVANARSNDISVVNPSTNGVIRTIIGVGLEPRGIAITSDGDADDTDEKVYVTQFNGVDRPNTIIGADDYKEGRVTVISSQNDSVTGQVVLAPIADVGFNSNGSSLKRIAPTNPATLLFTAQNSPASASLQAPQRFQTRALELIAFVPLRRLIRISHS